LASSVGFFSCDPGASLRQDDKEKGMRWKQAALEHGRQSVFSDLEDTD
jgi:hypothetical protein